MFKLLIATRNKGKLQEITNFLSDLPLKLVSFDDLKIQKDIEETGKSYKENSQKKALFYAKLSNLPTVADDGGIEIEALGNEPGPKSRRWLGYAATDEELINHMIKISQHLSKNNRTAYFKTVISFALPNGKIWSVKGEVKGIIAEKPYLKLLKGYPFRSFFYLPEIRKYYHEDELTNDEQKLYNHRWKAIQKLKSIIREQLG